LTKQASGGSRGGAQGAWPSYFLGLGLGLGFFETAPPPPYLGVWMTPPLLI